MRELENETITSSVNAEKSHLVGKAEIVVAVILNAICEKTMAQDILAKEVERSETQNTRKKPGRSKILKAIYTAKRKDPSKPKNAIFKKRPDVPMLMLVS